MKGNEGLVLTGQLGDVMKESARIALTYTRAHADELGIDDESFDDRSFHIHVPAGAIPKDGPSAGVTMTTALTSLLTGRPVKHTVGMTGEVTLQGRVLPIGGLKQKVLAAHAAGLTDVILPERNRADLDDVPEDVKEKMTFHPVMTLDEVLELALEPAAARMRCRSCAPIPEEVRRLAGLLERRSSISVIWASHEGAIRFNEFVAGAPPVPPGNVDRAADGARASRESSRASRSTTGRRASSTGSRREASGSPQQSRCSATSPSAAGRTFGRDQATSYRLSGCRSQVASLVPLAAYFLVGRKFPFRSYWPTWAPRLTPAVVEKR